MTIHDLKFYLSILADAIGWVVLLAPIWALLVVISVGFMGHAA